MNSQSPDSQSIDWEKALVGVNAKTGPYPTACSWSGGRRRIRGMEQFEANYFHVMSRTCGGTVFFDEVEKEALKRLLLRLAEFSGVKVLTYCVMGNHFHALIEVPHRASFLERFAGPEGEERLMEHLKVLYSKAHIAQLREQLSQWRKLGMESMVHVKLEGIKRRLCDLSLYVKEVKERFSRWYNKRHGRRGTLWMDRFKSVLVEGRERRFRGGSEGSEDRADALRTMSLYIDMNPVRAGLVNEAGVYEWSGYGDATRGVRRAQRGLCKAMGRAVDSWERDDLGAVYESWLATTPDLKKDEGKRSARETDQESKQAKKPGRVNVKNRLSLAELIRHRVRYFSDGAVIGSREFVEAVFEANRARFGPKRQTGARRIGESAEPFFSLRQLRRKPVG